jgi:Mg2+/citrate symporter
MSHIDDIAEAPLDELVRQLRKTTPGSSGNQEQWQAITIRLSVEGITRFREISRLVPEATDRLTTELKVAAEQSAKTSDQLLLLNERLYWLNWVMAVAGVLALVVGIVTLVVSGS